MDWVTLTIEVIGIAILCIWIVVPAREFRQIFAAIAHRNASAKQGGSTSAGESARGDRA